MLIAAASLLDFFQQQELTPQALLLQVLQGVPVDSRGTPRPWPELALLTVAEMLRTQIRMPLELGVPDAPAGVVASGIMADHYNQARANRTASEHSDLTLSQGQCEALLAASNNFWAGVLHQTVLNVLDPVPCKRGFSGTVPRASTFKGVALACNKAVSETVVLNMEYLEDSQQINAWLTTANVVLLGIATFVVSQPLKSGHLASCTALELTGLEVLAEVRGKGIGSMFVRAVTATLCDAMPALRYVTAQAAPLSHPYALNEKLASEYLMQALDARESLIRFGARVQEYLVPRSVTLSLAYMGQTA